MGTNRFGYICESIWEEQTLVRYVVMFSYILASTWLHFYLSTLEFMSCDIPTCNRYNYCPSRLSISYTAPTAAATPCTLVLTLCSIITIPITTISSIARPPSAPAAITSNVPHFFHAQLLNLNRASNDPFPSSHRISFPTILSRFQTTSAPPNAGEM